MKVVKRSARVGAAVSLVLLDWSVRESFHLLHYLERQTAARETFEVVVVEYYGREAAGLAPYREMVDTWVLLEMPAACDYHKHLMYNAGIVVARGAVVVFCDSDAMVRETFIASITRAFEDGARGVLHLDQVRNMRRDLYPFAYPSFAEVLGPGCINNVGGRPRGLGAVADPLHERNYGACMAARRADLVAIGGADEHVDYLGHICGPYEMTFRLGNRGMPERWHATEFLYHTWHPGQAGAGNRLGPHDGRHMSTTALAVLATGRSEPLVANPAVARLRADPAGDGRALEAALIAPDRVDRWTAARAFDSAHQAVDVPALPGHIEPALLDHIEDAKHQLDPADPVLIVEGYRGFNVVWWSGRFHAIPQGEGAFDPARLKRRSGYSRSFEGDSEADVKRSIDRNSRRAGWRTLLDLSRRISGRLF